LWTRLSRTFIPSTFAYRIGALLWITLPHITAMWLAEVLRVAETALLALRALAIFLVGARGSVLLYREESSRRSAA
jgi:hypothetical protein